jgi:hypothetical protein
MRTLQVTLVLPLLLLLAAGCGTIPDNITINVVAPTEDVGKIVQATFQAMTAQAGGQPAATQPPSASPSAGTGTISGTLNYPADSLPAMYVTAFQVGTQNYQYVITKPGQGTYQIGDLQPGMYHVIAYTVGGGSFPASLAGGYTQVVPCGFAASCTDHTLIDVAVAAGQTTSGILPGDWYAPQGTFPAFPQLAALATPAPTGAAILPPAIADGSIAGNLMFPASGIPALRIVAFRVDSSGYYYTDTALGESSYRMDHVPPGTYHVVAYSLAGGGFNAGTAGGYSQTVPCGLKYGCNDHTLIDVTVTAAHVTTDVDPNDYYADPGTFPANPAP